MSACLAACPPETDGDSQTDRARQACRETVTYIQTNLDIARDIGSDKKEKTDIQADIQTGGTRRTGRTDLPTE